MIRRLRWWLSGVLEAIGNRFLWWAEDVAPPTDPLDWSDILGVIEPTDTPFLRGINRDPQNWWKNTNG